MTYTRVVTSPYNGPETPGGQSAPGGPQPGWYQQPGTTEMRYWDGVQWTHHTAPTSPAQAAQDDSQASLPYILGIFFSFLPALIIFMTKKDSPRVRFHAAQVLNTEILLIGLHLAGMVLWLVGIFATVFTVESNGGPGVGFPASFGLLFLIWFGMLSLFVARVVVYIYMAIKTSNGEDRVLKYIPKLVKP